MSTNVHVAGVGSTKFGFHPGRTLQSLAVEAARAALSDANVPANRIGCLFVGNFVGGIMTGQELLGPIVAADLGLENVTAVKVEAACASSSAAVRLGHDLIHAQAQDAVLTVSAGSYHYDGNIGQALAGPDVPDNLNPIYAGHHKVNQNQGRGSSAIVQYF